MKARTIVWLSLVFMMSIVGGIILGNITNNSGVSLKMETYENAYYYSEPFKIKKENVTIRSNREASIEIINVLDENDSILIDKLSTTREHIHLNKDGIYRIRIENKNDELIVFVTGATNIE